MKNELEIEKPLADKWRRADADVCRFCGSRPILGTANPGNSPTLFCAKLDCKGIQIGGPKIKTVADAVRVWNKQNKTDEFLESEMF